MDLRNKTQLYAVHKRLTFALRIKGTESKGMGRCIPYKWKPKENREGCTYVIYNRLKPRSNKRQRKSLYNDRALDLSR